MKLEALSLNCFRINEMKAFYELLGLKVQDFQVSRGSSGYIVDFGDFKLKLLPTNVKSFEQSMPCYLLSLQTLNLAEIFKAVQIRAPLSILSDPFESSQGMAAMLRDPQGNTVELIEQKS